MELWNRRDICMPPNNSVKMKKEDVNIKHLKSIFNNALKVMEEKHLLHKEAALLSRYIYREQKAMRGQKVLMYMYKVNRGLKRYISLDLQHVYNNFYMMLSCDDDDKDEYTYVPTKQMLQYVLVRTQAFCKIMNYLSVACQNTALHCRATICRGHRINAGLFGLSMISRIWYCARYFMISACQWYSQLLPYLENLQIKGPRWLLTDYEFPENLRSWLGPDPITGELKYDADVQKISQEISQIEDFKDIGTLVKREDFLAIKEKACVPQRRNAKVDFITKNDKLSSSASSDAKLMSHDENSLLATKVKPFHSKPLQKVSNDLLEPISCDQFLTQRIENKSTSVGKHICNNMHLEGDVGELVSRDQFVVQKTRNESFSVINEFPKTSYDTQSENAQLSLTTTKDRLSSFDDTLVISRQSIRDDYSPMLETARKNIDESHKFTSSVVPGEKRNTEFKTVLHTPLKINKFISSDVSNTSINNVKSHKNMANGEKKSSSTNRCPSSKALTNAFNSLDDSQVHENELFLKSDGASKKIATCIQKTFMNTSTDNSQIQNKFVQNIQSLNTLKSNQHLPNTLKFELNIEQVSDISVAEQQYAISSGPLVKKKYKKALGNWEIINGIRTLQDVKTFLHSEKKARAKGKHCVTSKLNNTEWNILLEAIKTFLKKESVSKIKANKKMKSVMDDVRNTLISFVV